MLPRWHILFGALASLLIWILFPQIGFYAWVVFLSTFLIDVDHYLEYVFRQRDISLINALRYYHYRLRFFKKMPKKHWRKYKEHYLVFHVIEFWIILALLGLLHPVFWFILLGMGIHMLLDYIVMFWMGDIMLSKISLIAIVLSNKNRTVLKIEDMIDDFD